jgi:hypothetical protein
VLSCRVAQEMGLETWAVEGVVGCIAAAATEQEAAKVLRVSAQLLPPLRRQLLARLCALLLKSIPHPPICHVRVGRA